MSLIHADSQFVVSMGVLPLNLNLKRYGCMTCSKVRFAGLVNVMVTHNIHSRFSLFGIVCQNIFIMF